MASVLHIADPVVTGEMFKRQHQGQTQVCVGQRAVVTPTAWDYIREHRLQLVRGETPAAPAPTGPAVSLVREAQPPAMATATQLVPESRCEHPEQPYGCKTDEFGSGFVEPSSCHDCQVHADCKESRAAGGCEGCNRHHTFQSLAPVDLEALVQQITDQIMAQLED